MAEKNYLCYILEKNEDGASGERCLYSQLKIEGDA